MIAPGLKLGRYRLRAPLGAGGMSAVYRAHDPMLDREVALKILAPELAREAVYRERFQEEARALGAVQHPNLIQIYTVEQEGDVCFYAMELIDGRTLADVLQIRGRLTLAETLAIYLPFLSGLEAAHKAGIIHRDVKPGNIMLDSAGRVILMDFGLSRRTDRQRLTIAGAVVGTPEYMSPEQARGEKSDERSDLYSAGVLLFEMLSGRPPFEGKDTVAILRKHVEAPTPSLKDLSPDTPPALAAIVAKLLEKRPDKRYPHVAALVAALTPFKEPGVKREQIVQGLLAEVNKVGARVTKSALVAPQQEPAADAPVSRKLSAQPSVQTPPRKSALLWMAAAIAVLALLVSLAALARASHMRRGAETPPASRAVPAPAKPGDAWRSVQLRGGNDTFSGALTAIERDSGGEQTWVFKLRNGDVRRVALDQLKQAESEEGGDKQ